MATAQRSPATTTRFRASLFVLAAPMLILAIAAAAQQPPGPATVLSLPEALTSIAAHSEAAVAAGLDVDAAREVTRRAQSAYVPSVSLSGSYMARDNPVVGVLENLAVAETERDFFAGELDATYLLWDGGRRSSGVEVARRGEDAAARGGSAEVQAAVLDGLATYLQVLAAKAQRVVMEQRIKSLRDHLRVAQDLYDHGVVARNDLLETEVRLRLVEDQATQVDNGEAVAVQALNRLMGRAPSEPLALPAGLAPPPPLAVAIGELKQRALAANPQLRALRARLAAQEAGVAARKAEDYPTTFAEATHTYQQNRFLLYPNANYLLLGASWQAFDGGARKSAVREAEFAAAKTRTQIEDLQRSVEVHLDEAYRDLEQARREAATAQTNIGAADENLRIEEDQYKAGLARTTDVLDAESVLAESRFALVNQNYNAYLKEGIVLSTAGEDLPTAFAAVKEQ